MKWIIVIITNEIIHWARSKDKIDFAMSARTRSPTPHYYNWNYVFLYFFLFFSFKTSLQFDDFHSVHRKVWSRAQYNFLAYFVLYYDSNEPSELLVTLWKKKCFRSIWTLTAHRPKSSAELKRKHQPIEPIDIDFHCSPITNSIGIDMPLYGRLSANICSISSFSFNTNCLQRPIAVQSMHIDHHRFKWNSLKRQKVLKLLWSANSS